MTLQAQPALIPFFPFPCATLSLKLVYSWPTIPFPPFWLAMLPDTSPMVFTEIPSYPLLMAFTPWMRAWLPAVTPAHPMPRMVPESTVRPLRSSAAIPTPRPVGAHPERSQAVGPEMVCPARSMVTSSTVTRMAVVSASGTTRSRHSW